MQNTLEYLQSGNGFFLLAGPCVIEGEQMALDIAGEIDRTCRRLGIPFAFKGSYRKANRSRLDSFTGIGDEKALAILSRVGSEFNVPTVTDIHECHEAAMAAEHVDILLIPAFRCRQTDLLVAAARTGKMVNIKKGQFLAPESMRFAVEKVRAAGGTQVAVTERGTTFGYGDLVVDFRGRPELIETIARAAIATGADGIFLETHRNPAEAKSDGANMLPLDRLEKLLEHLCALRDTVNTFK